MLRPEVLKWLQQTQKLLREKFELDTSNRMDMGRIKLNQPWESGIFGNHALLPGEQITGSPRRSPAVGTAGEERCSGKAPEL